MRLALYFNVFLPIQQLYSCLMCGWSVILKLLHEIIRPASFYFKLSPGFFGAGRFFAI